MGSHGSFSTVILNKENASNIWRLIQQTGDELLGKLPSHPNHPKGRNPYAHVVLRGGNGKPNYDSVSVSICEQELLAAGIKPNIMVDCSHANSNKDHNLQPLVLDNVANQILEGNTSIVGAMIESHLNAGNQKLSNDPDELAYGVSVTDACVDWKTTEASLLAMADKLREALKDRRS